uniref:replication initiation protein n=1 Tax=Bifidobacterium longum TaxID=216816 RepID=UPI001495A009
VRRSRADALRCKHVEANPACQANMIVCDIDDEYGRAMALYEHPGMRPNFIAENPANGHCHAGWVLTEPVCRTDMARLKPLKLLHA